MIEIRRLTKRYGDLTAVCDLTLEVRAGEIYGFLGPNGAGKTTTLKVLAGLLLPTSGEARVGGHDVVREPEAAKRLTAFIPDRPYLYERLTPAEYLRFLGGVYGIPPAEADRRGERALDLFGLVPWKDRLIESFSHGMKQKVVLAGALLVRPRALIVDEPMVGLDPSSARLVKELFSRLAAKGCAVMLSTHTLEVAEKLCGRVGILQGGRLLAEGTLEELRARAKQERADLETLFLELTGGPRIEEVLKDF